jgi:hypothetical protein
MAYNKKILLSNLSDNVFPFLKNKRKARNKASKTPDKIIYSIIETGISCKDKKY